MNYKKIVVFLTIMFGAAALWRAGSWSESPGSAAKQNTYAASDKRETGESRKIAVVNLDEGVTKDEGRVNYAERLSRFPSMDFEYASLEAARTGLETGKYGAYIIIPAAFSQNVESINTAPQVSQLEYTVSQSCSGRRQYELLYHVWSYIDSLNNHLSYMYVDNILREFHDAQDEAGRVMENDLRDLEAMERIQSQEWITLAEMPKMPEKEEIPEMSDISGYTTQISLLEESVGAQYESSVRDIQTQIAALGAGGKSLADCLENLAGQTVELDLTLDGNGESIAGKAEGLLRAELERQTELILEKEFVTEGLRELRDSNEEMLKRFEQSTGINDSKEGEAQQDLQGLLLEQAQELEKLIEEADQAENFDMDKITELVQREYMDPINSNVNEAKKAFQQRYEAELTAVRAYNGQLAGFHPQMNSQFLEQSIRKLKENHENMQNALLVNNQAYMDYAQKSADLSKDYTDKLEKYISEVQNSSRDAVAEGMSAAKKVKEKNSAMNQRILGDFASKLPYTRLGNAEYMSVYQFIASPLSAADRSGNPVAD